jgi:phenylalanyl-tRNA synthetase alpha subunit
MEDFGGIDNISDLANTYSSDFGTIRSFLEKDKELQDRLNKMESFVPRIKNRTENKRAMNNLKVEIAKNEKAKNDKLKEAKDNEKKLQNEINNSSESDFVVQGKTFTAHRDSNNKIIGYSDKGSNVVNMAGMPPIGPGQRIKKSKTPTGIVRPGR